LEGGDRRQDELARRKVVAADSRRRLQLAGDVDDHRSRPQRLFDGGGQVVLLADGERAAQLRQHVRVADQALDRPGEARRGRLVPGSEHGDELVAQFPVAHRGARLVAGVEQQREDVVALLVTGLGPSQPDLFVDEPVEGGPRALEAVPGTERPEVAAQHREGGDDSDPLGEVVDQPLETAEPRLVVDAEDGPHDHRQGDPLGVRPQRERLADRPALHLPPRRLDDQRAVALDPLAVEGRQQQLALAHVRLVVEGEDAVRPRRRLQHRRVRLAGVEDRRRASEDLFHQIGPGDVDDPPEEGEVDAEDVPVAALLLREEPEWVAQVAGGLDEGGRARPGR
jgi:hypothetical protein